MKPGLVRLAVQLLAAAAVGGVFGAVICRHLVDDPVSQQLSLSSIDIAFAQDMSAHHQQAALMADMLTPDAAPEVRALADQIQFTQMREIGIMMGWLQIAQAPMMSASPMAWMSADDHHHTAGSGIMMPGLASPDDLIRLQSATGHDNETIFLQLMIRHHQGGIDMAAYANTHTTSDPVRRTALAMVDEQTQEIGLMTVMLEQRGASTLPYP